MTRAWVWLGALGALGASPGCTDRACMQWGEADGACPTSDEALTFMRGGEVDVCGTPRVISVDSEGDFDGQACCYDVTESETAEGDVICAGTSGPVPGSAVAVTSGSTTSGFCGDGACDGSIGEDCTTCGDCGSCEPPGCDLGQDGCIGCAELVTFAECTSSDLCPRSEVLLTAVTTCACMTCGVECADNVCADPAQSATDRCNICVQMSCVQEVTDCVNDVSD